VGVYLIYEKIEMLTVSVKKTFLDMGIVLPEKSDIVMVPFGLEKTTTFGKGTAKGPQRIIEVSPNLEVFDEELEKDISKEVKISTIEEPKIKHDHDEAIMQLEEVADEIYRFDKFPLILGGEHSLTLGALRSALKKYKEVSILQFDAHADLRDSYEGNKFSHAAVMRRCLELPGINLVQIGIRNINNDEQDGKEYEFLLKNQERIKTFWGKNMAEWQISKIIEGLGENVYLSFDLDVFDSGFMPSTGTPEPGGLDWWQALDIIKKVAVKKRIIGADVVELMPIEGLAAPDFLAAKLIYKIIGYRFCLKY
jgi:agmatinase